MGQDLQTASLQDNPKRGAADIAALLFVFIASALPFLASSQFGMVNCDDYDYMRHVAECRPVFGLEQAIFMPVTWLTYKLDFLLARALHVDTCHLMHLQGVLWHALNATLLYGVLSRLFKRATRTALAVATLLWAVHPLRVESVVWIASRKDVVSMSFLLAAWHSWLGYRKSGRVLSYLLSVALMLFGCSAKPSVMVLPAAIILSEFLVINARKGTDKRELARFLFQCVPLFAISVVTAIVASIAQRVGGAMDIQHVVPLWWKVSNAVSSVGVYTINLVFPINLAPQCLIRWPELPRGLLQGVVVCTLFSLAIFGLWKRQQGAMYSKVLCGLLFFLIAFVPVLGIVGFGIHAFADRFTYIPAIGVSIVLLAILEASRHSMCCIFAVLTLPLAILTYKQTLYWENDGTLWQRTIDVDGPSNCDAFINLGLYHFEFTHKLDKSINCFENAYKANPYRSGRILQFHLMSLFEVGDHEAMRTVYHNLSSWDVKEVARARAAGLDVGHTLGFLIGRILFLQGDDTLKKEVQREKNMLLSKLSEDTNVKYMQYLLGELPPEKVTCNDSLEYVQYRFLRTDNTNDSSAGIDTEHIQEDRE